MHKSLRDAVTQALAFVTPESRKVAREIDADLARDPLDESDWSWRQNQPADE